jgi:2'-5' RNA ligase
MGRHLPSGHRSGLEVYIVSPAVAGRSPSRRGRRYTESNAHLVLSAAPPLRAFLAVPVGPPAHGLLAAHVERLRPRVVGVRWVDTATTHITLHFFAALPLDRMDGLIEAARAAAARAQPFTLRLGGLGSFPGGARARVLWIGLAEESAPLAGLAAVIGAAVARCGFEVDPRGFRPHVTLGRPTPHFDLGGWRSERAVHVELPAFTADQIVLYESRDGHHVRERLPLGIAAGRRSTRAATPAR